MRHRFDPKTKPNRTAHKAYNHLMDDRYEVRDAQYLMSVLADEGIVQPKKIGVTGASYGGGISIALAALRNREMEPTGATGPVGKPRRRANGNRRRGAAVAVDRHRLLARPRTVATSTT